MKCDAFVLGQHKGAEFGPLHIFDKNFVCMPGKKYSGYLGLNVERVKMVSIVTELKRKGIEVFSSPVRYRDVSNIEFEKAAAFAVDYARAKGFDVVFDSSRTEKSPPVFWVFSIVGGDEGKVGGVVMIDRLDGHVWGELEYIEYMYDYNNVL
ncbi:hypothetical protein [Pseudomonas sp. ICMP 10191]|uniref:hypothetical protein n=1 Tax=Pseudomonas sp. ICMP 10191 TaxID=1198294 RepID=UPI000AD55BE0|nr:hypothetical protein [Pseudomonas sp. ICMP 10191]